MRKKITELKKTRGRPKASGLVVPSWAAKAITDLGAKSGVTAQKILEVALRDGIQLVGEPLGAWIKYGQSSERLWNEHVTGNATAPSQEPRQTTSDTFDDIELEPDELGTTVTTPYRLDDVDERPGQLEEVRSDNGSAETLTGE